MPGGGARPADSRRGNSAEETAGGGWPFVDREGELDAVLAVVGGAAAASVVVAGPQGGGRTRLAQEVTRAAAAAGRRVEWVTCTRVTAAIPLGAIAQLVPAAGAATDLAAAWRAMVSTLAPDRENDRPTVVVFDDAHLLNDLCAALVHRLVLTRAASVVLTVSEAAPAPLPVDALWKDGLATRVDLAPLSRTHVRRILTATLGGLVESRTCQDLWRASGGNTLLLRELVEASRVTGHLLPRDGLWRWDGTAELTQRLRSVLRAQLGELTPAEREALEFLAVGEALELDDLVGLTSAEVVTTLERRGLVLVEEASGRPVALVAQPLHVQVLRAQLPHSAAGQFRRRLAATPSVRRCLHEDPVRVSSLLLAGDAFEPERDVLARAATQANASSDHGLAERLARSALARGPDASACAALAESLRWQGRHVEAEQVADAAAALAHPSRQREDIDTTRMLNLFFGLGRVEEALAVAGDDRGPRSGGVVPAVAAVLHLAAGSPQSSLALVDDGLSGADDARVRLWVSVARTTGLALLGHIPEALDSAADGWAALAAGAAGTESSAACAALAFGELLALELSGRLQQHQARMDAFHELAMARAASAMDGVAALGLGCGLLASGRVVEAVRWLTEAAATLVHTDPIGSLRLCRARQAQAHALLGDPASARSALAGARAPSPVRLFDAEVLLAESWLAAAEHREDEAGAAAIAAASVAAALGQRPVEARALHTAARLGRAGGMTDRLHQLSEELDDRLLHAFAAQADAAASGSGERLDDVADEFVELGAQALAADARAQAAEAHRGAGHRRQASASAASAASLARSSGGIRTPALEGLVPHVLSAREREVATLAAQGVSNQEIARRLVLSVRTVETHLARVYDKLGIHRRGALRDALAAEP
ncbi:MAG TPA: LuxR C-terminal-related transcriptional regulator [Geodermatophilus sp.]|nr:LuxR C-terminal-related transcriptional regulator [Geodermatophilus sp.]